MASYTQKVIRSGKYIEVYSYANPIRTGQTHKHKHVKKPKSVKLATDKKPQTSRKDSLTRTRQHITRLVNANPEFLIFVTLTYAVNNGDLSNTNANFHNFIKRLRRIFPSLIYLSVPEFQTRGAVHYHVLFNIKYIDPKLLEKIWGHGFVKIRAIEEIENVGLYISSYIRKELMDSRLFGRQKFMRSKGLKNPIVSKHKKSVANFFLADVAGAKLIKQNEYEGEYIGKVKWDLYQITDPDLVLPENMR